MSETKITEYSQVPWFRRNGFVFLAWLLCSPVAIGIFWTGEVYYMKNGEIRTYGFFAKALLTFIAVVTILGMLGFLD
jgi:hypothetical protein